MASDNRGVPQLEDDECGWDAAGLLRTLSEICCRISNELGVFKPINIKDRGGLYLSSKIFKQ